MSGTRHRRERLLWALALLVCAGLTATLAAISWTSATRLALERERMEVGAAAELQARALEGLLDKYRALPALLAHRDDIRALFSEAPDETMRMAGRAAALDVAGLTGAVDVLLLRPSGEPLATARDVLSARLLPRLTIAPRQGRLGRAAFADPSEGPLYVFSHAVRGPGGGVVGVVAVVVGLSAIEETWALALDAIHVEDAAGRFVVGNDLARSRLERAGTGIERSVHLARVNWRLFVVRDAAPVAAAGRNALGLALLAGVLVSGLAALALHRALAARSRARVERAGALRLERRVRDRTRDLTREMREREEAERRLRAAQDDLAHAVKLAALGRMSAALAHEYNQPLAAIRAYAENAGRLLERGRDTEVPGTLARIVAVAERMGGLAKTLRSFARRPGSATGPVSLADAWDDALTIVRPLARERGVAITAQGLAEAPPVRAGRLRLGQVLLNLLSNAVEACQDRDERCVAVRAVQDGETVRLSVRDTGPGVDPAVRDDLFEPFVTTKPVGEGLGLGLAIAFNVVRDFGGTLRLKDEGLAGEGPGATFELVLQVADAEGARTVDAPSLADVEPLHAGDAPTLAEADPPVDA